MAAGNFVQGLAQGLVQGNQMNLQRRQLDMTEERERRIEEIARGQQDLQREQLKIAQQTQAVQGASALINSINAIQAMPDSLRGTLAPQVLKPFIDVNTEEGKAFVKAATAADEEGVAYFQSLVGGLFKNPDAKAALASPEMKRQFRLNPIGTLTSLAQLSSAMKKEDDTIILPEGGTLVRKSTGAVVAQNVPSGPFQGKGMDAQVMNFLLNPKSDTSSPGYKAAYNYLARPRFDMESGQMIQPDMSAFRAPGAPVGAGVPQDTAAPVSGGGGAPAPAGGGVPAPQAEGPTVRPIPGFKPKLNLTPAEKKADEEFAKEYSELSAGGGFADVEKNIKQLEGVISQLGKRGDLTGPVVGNLPDFIKNVTNPSSVAAQQTVEEVVQRNLRLVLGAQFTEKEGERLIARAYNPRASEKDNKERVSRLLKSIKDAYEAKIAAGKYYEENGTLKGYKGSARFSIEDIENDSGLGVDPDEKSTLKEKYGLD